MKVKVLLLLAAFVFASTTYGQKNATKKVAILKTVDKEGILSYGMELMIRSKLAFAITNISGYEGYERVDIASIMSEQEFQRTGMVSDTQIKRLGEMTGAGYILIAEVAKIDDVYIFIKAQILNVETAKLENTYDILTRTDIDEMENACRELAIRLFSVSQENDFVEKPTNIAQSNSPRKDEEKVPDVVEIMPSFPGGQAALLSWLSSNVKYPVAAEENGIQGRVVCTFVVERDGSITDVQVVRGVDPWLDKEAVRVLLTMPKWNPGIQNGAPVRVKYTCPVTFRLQGDDNSSKPKKKKFLGITWKH